MRHGTVQANGVTFTYLEEGEGPLVLLLHGFPDTPHTWDALMPALAANGYRAVAPYTRGYHPTEIPQGGYFDASTLATDARALIEALGGGEPASVIGHDWGGATTWYLVSAYPEAVRRAVALSIPHPILIAGMFGNPAALHAVFHFWFFQMEGLAEGAIRANDFAFIDYLYGLWSPGLDAAEQLAHVKAAFAQPGSLEAALAYYRAMFNPSRQDPALAHVSGSLGKPITVPTMSILGTREVVDPGDGGSQAGFFAPGTDFRFEALDAGHFVHRERPDDVSKLVLEWLSA